MKKIVAIIIAVALSLCLFAGCASENGGEPASGTAGEPSPTGQGTTTAASPTGGNAVTSPSQPEGTDDPVLTPYRSHVNLILSQPPDKLDPHLYDNLAAGSVCGQIFDQLFLISATRDEEPRLALNYDVSADGLTYTYHLRPGVFFSDGSPFTANDVVFSFGRMRPDTVRDAILREVIATDDLTVEFRLNSVSATFHSRISAVLIASESAVTAAGDQAAVSPIGTGPFMLDKNSFNIDQHITLIRNPNYWNPDEVQLESATYYVITDETTQYNAFEAGDADMLVVGANYWPGVLESGKYNTVSGAIGLTTYIVFNTTTAPWNDVRVRRAFNYAINNELIVALAYNGIGVPALTAAPPGVIKGAVYPDSPYRYDPQKARELFAEAGVSDVGPLMTVAGITKSILEIIQQNLLDIGIKMDIEVLDPASLTAARNSGTFTAATIGIYLDQEFDQYALIYTTDGVLNHSRLYDPLVDELFITAGTTTDTDARYAIYRRIINIVDEEARHHYIAHGIFTYAYDPHLSQIGAEDGLTLLRRFVWDLVP